jgi:hypothetical protein
MVPDIKEVLNVLDTTFAASSECVNGSIQMPENFLYKVLDYFYPGSQTHKQVTHEASFHRTFRRGLSPYQV